MISAFFARAVILVFGTLFPAYYSYKAVKTKNVKEYVKWMMYWIVFAFFTCAETITDLFLAFWFPFYYEAKILMVVWLLSPATRGSSVLYRKFVHPWLTQRENEIDDYIDKAKQQGYSTVIQLGSKGVNYASKVIMETAIKGGGGIVNHLKRSYSVGELNHSDTDHHDGGDHNRNIKALPSNSQDYHHGHGSKKAGTPVITLLEEEQSSGDEAFEELSTISSISSVSPPPSTVEGGAKQIRRSNRCRKQRLFDN